MAGKAKELTPEEARDKEIADARDVEADRQKAVDEAMEKFLAENAAEAQQALKDQQEYETTGIRKVVGKP